MASKHPKSRSHTHTHHVCFAKVAAGYAASRVVLRVKGVKVIEAIGDVRDVSNRACGVLLTQRETSRQVATSEVTEVIYLLQYVSYRRQRASLCPCLST